MKLDVPMSDGSTATLSGAKSGPFLIHEPSHGFGCCWHVTHIKTGLRFPCEFWERKSAFAFVRRVQKIMDFSKIDVSAPSRGQVKAEWVNGGPTLEQREAIKDLMKELTT